MVPDKLTDRQFKAFCRIVCNEAVIKLSDEKRERPTVRLAKRLRALSMNAAGCLKRIQADAEAMRRFLDAISTNPTPFSREPRRFQSREPTCRTIWRAASSSGEEPYSLAAYCLVNGFTPSIPATGISVPCLEKGRRGIYLLQGVSTIPAGMLKSCFQKSRNQWEADARAKEHAGKTIRFDLISCRNPMTCFEPPTRERGIRKLVVSLRRKGRFIIGGAESLSGLNHRLFSVEPGI
jgi:chemotaxis methyl-accepting protein methylase